MTRKSIFFLVFLFWSIGHLAAQVLIMENKNINKVYSLKPGRAFFVQTFDDPAGYSTKVIFLSYKNDTINVKAPVRKGKVIHLPLSHIAAFYVQKPIAYKLLRLGVIAYGIIFTITAVVDAIDDEYYALPGVFVSLPLIKIGIDMKTKDRINISNYDFFNVPLN